MKLETDDAAPGSIVSIDDGIVVAAGIGAIPRHDAAEAGQGPHELATVPAEFSFESGGDV